MTWADLAVLKMSLAALFCTFWSSERRYLEQPAKSEFFGDIFGQIVAYCTNPTNFQIVRTTNGGDLLLERMSRIKADTLVANGVAKFDAKTLPVHGLWNGVRVEKRL